MEKKKLLSINSITIFALISILFLAASSCGVHRRPRRRGIHKKKGIFHVVKKHETLWRIAKTYNIDLKKLARVNRIKDIRQIRQGQKIFIPGARRVKKVSIYVPQKDLKAKPKKRKKIHYKKPAFKWPLKGKFTSSFGIRKNRRHDGIDIAAPKNSYIRASASGKVIFSGWGPKGYGKIVIIKHSGNIITIYAHNNKNIVKKNQHVKQGQKIAKVGNTGRSTGPHLHFEIRVDKIPHDPLKYLP